MTLSEIQTPPQGQRARWLRIAVLLAGYLLIMVLGHFAGRWLQQHLGFDPMNAQSQGALTALLIGLLVYTVFLALPFVPGIEISLALFAVFGASVAIPVYCATLVALLASYVAGRFVPLTSLAAFFDYIGLRAAGSLVRQLGSKTPRERIATLVELAPNRSSGLLVRYRELALIAALNVPGNALIGGGGGIALVAGMSGLFPLARYILAIAVASVPIPLAMALTGHALR